MVRKLFEINETATFAWNPTQPILATGTLSGTLDDTFSNTSILKLYDYKATILGQVNSSSRFNKLVWSRNGVIAGGLEDGRLLLWQSQAILDKRENSLLLSSSIHTGPINSLDVKDHLLASASNEVYIWDLNKQEPFIATKQPVNHLSWNGQFQHIIAMGLNGQMVIWDLRHKREVKTIPVQAPTSAVWHPDQTTQLATSSANGTITLWDLRHTQVPERTMSGHTDAILDLSWCRQDSDLLLSCGKDGKTMIWNPNSGEAIREVSQHPNWTFKTSWSPCHPDLLASASYDGKIQVYSLQQTERVANDPFSAALNLPQTLKQPPKWFRRPIGATFAFGGKLIIFHSRKIKSVTVVTEEEAIQRATELENALIGGQQLDTLVDKYEEKNNDSWKVIRALLVQENQREHLIHYLGFERDRISSEIDKLLGDKKPLDAILAEKEVQPVTKNSDFFTQVQEQQRQEPLKLYSQSNSDIDSLIARTVVLGDFESTVNLCLYQNRLSDALMFSIYGGKDLLEKTQQSYFQRATNRPYVSLLKSVMTNDLGHMVKSCSLNDWKSTLVALCSYAMPEEFSQHCDLLGQRLEAASMLKESLVCYLSSKNIENVCRIWISDLVSNTDLDVQHIMERIIIFIKTIGFNDELLSGEPSEKPLLSYPLSPLYELYIKYAHFLASQGRLSSSLYYLNQIPRQYDSIQLALLRDRVYNASSSNIIVQIQRPTVPYEIKPITSIQTPVQRYKPVIASPLISNNYTTAYTPAAAASPLTPNNYTPTTTSTMYSYSASTSSPRLNNSHAPIKSVQHSPRVHYTQVTNTYSPTSSYIRPNNGYTTLNKSYPPSPTVSPQNSNYSQQQSSQFTHYTSNGDYQATSNYSPLQQTSTQNLTSNYYPITSGFQQPSPHSVPTTTSYRQSYSPKIPAPPPIVDALPVTETTPKPTAFHDPPPMLMNKTPKRNTTPVKRVMSPFPNQNISYQNTYSPIGSPQPKNILPPPPMNASAPAPLSRQKTPNYGNYQQNPRMN
ncbi:hypothetical protein K501DRAFT_222721 [Backusella circina FSU 941]|nr:hypothetical protein K501DRAFT_222721 [Backusella circina FSU 941]